MTAAAPIKGHTKSPNCRPMTASTTMPATPATTGTTNHHIVPHHPPRHQDRPPRRRGRATPAGDQEGSPRKEGKQVGGQLAPHQQKDDPRGHEPAQQKFARGPAPPLPHRRRRQRRQRRT